MQCAHRWTLLDRAGVCDEDVTGVTTHGDVSGRCPNSAVPTRTHVEPCFTADFQVAGHPCRQPEAPADSRAVPAGVRRQAARTRHRDRHPAAGCPSAREFQRRGRLHLGAQFVDRSGRPMSTPPRETSPSRLIWMYTRSGSDRPPSASARPDARSSAVTTLALSTECARVPSRRSTGPCCAESGRPCASESAGRARRNCIRPISRPLLVRAIRQKHDNPDRDKIRTSVAGKNFVTGSNSISALLRPAASAARASRSRTWVSALANSISRACVPLCARSFHPHHRCESAGRRVPAVAEQVASATVHRGSTSTAPTPDSIN